MMSLGRSLCIVGLLLVSTTASGQKPQRTTATFGDWMVRCEQSGEERLCEMVGAVAIEGRATPVAQVAIGLKEEGIYRLVVQLPLNVWLPADPTLSVAATQVTIAEFKRCFPQFCLAEAEIAEAALLDWQGQTGAATIAFKDGAQRDVAVPLSFEGFADAFVALKNPPL